MTPESWSNAIVALVLLLSFSAGRPLSWVVFRSPRRAAHRGRQRSSEMRERFRAVVDRSQRRHALSKERSRARKAGGVIRAGAASGATC
jgi:hypothetical protein